MMDDGLRGGSRDIGKGVKPEKAKDNSFSEIRENSLKMNSE